VAEAYLNKAEAEALSGKGGAAMECIRMIGYDAVHAVPGPAHRS